jgi:hypothetical protein
VGDRYTPWYPCDGATGEYFIVWFEHRPETGAILEVEPLDENKVLRVWFDNAIAFREHPHDILMRSWWESHSFYRVHDSKWAHWLEQESQGIWRAVEFTHYGCKTVDGCYEVLSTTEPRAEWITPNLSLNPGARVRSGS